MLTRRGFLALSSLAAASAALPTHLRAQRIGGDVFSSAYLGVYAQGLVTAEHFTPLIGTKFRVFLEDGTVSAMRLRKVKQRSAQMLTPAQTEDVVSHLQSLYRNTLRMQSFMLLFDMIGPAFPQDTYLVDHATLGRFSVCLSAGETTCHAVFTYFDGGEPAS